MRLKFVSLLRPFPVAEERVEQNGWIERETPGRHHYGFGHRSSGHERIGEDAGKVFDPVRD